MEFELTPASSGTVVSLWLICAVLVATALMFVLVAWSATHGSFTVSNDELQPRIPIYGRSIPISNLDLVHARVLDADDAAAIRESVRTNGVGMPGYAAGWFKLASGSKALLAVTRGPVLFIPTSEGYSLAVSVAHPDAALQQLKLAGGA
jgi:hypothetical protein